MNENDLGPNVNDVDEIRALESLRADGEQDPRSVADTRRKLLSHRAARAGRSRLGPRLAVAATFVAALAVGAAATPHVLEWWEHLHVTEEPLPDGRSHVVALDDEGNTVLDDVLEADEALLQIEPQSEGDAPTLIRVAPDSPPGDTQANAAHPRTDTAPPTKPNPR